MSTGDKSRPTGLRAAAIALVVAAVLSAATTAGAAESNEASTYGADGIAVAALGLNYLDTHIPSVTARADGGLIVQRDDKVESFLPDGALDPAAPPAKVQPGRRVFPAAGGKTLVVTGEMLTRLNPDGTRDKSFGGTGTVGAALYAPVAAVELGSGRIVEVGATIVGPRSYTGVVQTKVLNPNGTFVPGAGQLAPSLPIEREIGILEFAPLPDGGALVVDESFLLELRPDGSRDPAFGKGGFVLVKHLAGAAVRPDGSIEAVGQSTVEPTGDLAVFRFTPDGQPDASFAPEGVRRFNLGGALTANTASWAADGSVVVAGYEVPQCEEDCESVPILAAVDAAGNLQTSFGEGGALRLATFLGPGLGFEKHGATALTRRPDGSLVVAGNAPPEETTGFLAAVTSTGQLIPTFGEGGIARLRTPVPAGQELAGIAALPEGGTIAAGTTELNVGETPVLIRYAADGSLDPAFGGGAGYVVLGESVPHGPAGFAVAGEVALTSLRRQLLMYRTGNGERLSTFGAGGSVTLPAKVKVTALAFAPNGDPLVLLHHDGGDHSEVLRYLPDGSLDQSFGQGGAAPLRLPGGGEVRASSLAVDADGTLVVSGTSQGRFALGSLGADGRPNRHFGKGGWALVDGGAPAEPPLATPTGDGSRIYMAGCVAVGDQLNPVVLMRFDRHGRLDRGFGHRGRIVTRNTRNSAPTLIAPGSHGALVTLEFGPLPILSFSDSGKVRRRNPGPKVEFVAGVVGSAAGGRLHLAWSHQVTRTITQRSYISVSPLRP